MAEEGSLYPAPVVKYVIRTRGDLLLGNAVDQSIYDSDPYIKERQVKSVLCLPLMLSSQLLGVVYLEHSILANAFTLEVAEFLKPLINQTVICAANARKMQGQEQLVESLEGILEERTAELKGVHQELEAFSFTVCHDLKAPTRRIMALCDMLMEDIDDPRLSQQAGEALQLLKQSSGEMTELLGGLLQWSEWSYRSSV
jgi:GAF domain-containing protein